MSAVELQRRQHPQRAFKENVAYFCVLQVIDEQA